MLYGKRRARALSYSLEGNARADLAYAERLIAAGQASILSALRRNRHLFIDETQLSKPCQILLDAGAEALLLITQEQAAAELRQRAGSADWIDAASGTAEAERNGLRELARAHLLARLAVNADPAVPLAIENSTLIEFSGDGPLARNLIVTLEEDMSEAPGEAELEPVADSALSLLPQASVLCRQRLEKALATNCYYRSGTTVIGDSESAFEEKASLLSQALELKLASSDRLRLAVKGGEQLLHIYDEADSSPHPLCGLELGPEFDFAGRLHKPALNVDNTPEYSHLPHCPECEKVVARRVGPRDAPLSNETLQVVESASHELVAGSKSWSELCDRFETLANAKVAEELLRRLVREERGDWNRVLGRVCALAGYELSEETEARMLARKNLLPTALEQALAHYQCRPGEQLEMRRDLAGLALASENSMPAEGWAAETDSPAVQRLSAPTVPA